MFCINNHEMQPSAKFCAACGGAASQPPVKNAVAAETNAGKRRKSFSALGAAAGVAGFLIVGLFNFFNNDDAVADPPHSPPVLNCRSSSQIQQAAFSLGFGNPPHTAISAADWNNAMRTDCDFTGGFELVSTGQRVQLRQTPSDFDLLETLVNSGGWAAAGQLFGGVAIQNLFQTEVNAAMNALVSTCNHEVVAFIEESTLIPGCVRSW